MGHHTSRTQLRPCLCRVDDARANIRLASPNASDCWLLQRIRSTGLGLSGKIAATTYLSSARNECIRTVGRGCVTPLAPMKLNSVRVTHAANEADWSCTPGIRTMNLTASWHRLSL